MKEERKASNMEKWNKKYGKRVISATLCAVMVASMSAPTMPVSATGSVKIKALGESLELLLEDRSLNLSQYLDDNLKDKTTVKIGIDSISSPNTTIPRQVKNIIGWEKMFWIDEEKLRDLGSKVDNQKFTFEEGSDITVRKIKFVEKVEVTIPVGVTVRFEDCVFDSTIINNGSATFNNCIFTTGEIIDNGTAIYEGGTKEPTNKATQGELAPEEVATEEVTQGQENHTTQQDSELTVKPSEEVQADETTTTPTETEQKGETQTSSNEVTGSTELVIDDTSYDLDTLLEPVKTTVEVIKVGVNNLGMKEVVLPKQVKQVLGWQKKTFLYEEGEAIRDFGSKVKEQKFTFSEDSNVTVRKIRFAKDVIVTIPKGATVRFEECTFNSTITNGGVAVFDHCTFATGQITNNGAAEYTNGTETPKNLGTAKDDVGTFPLGMNLSTTKLQDGVKGKAYTGEVTYELSGTNKDSANVTATIVQKDSGMTAEVKENKIIVTGTPKTTDRIQIKVVAIADGKESVEKQIEFEIYGSFQVELEGTLNCGIIKSKKRKTLMSMKKQGFTLDAVSTASISSGGGTIIDGGGNVTLQNTLTPYIISEDGTKVKWYEYSRDNKDAKIEVKVSPEGSGVTGECLFGTVTLKGTPIKKGNYKVSVTIQDKGQEVTSNSVDYNIYNGDETLKEQFATLDVSKDSWDIEPYEIEVSDHAIVPKSLKTIYGSHQSGTYAILGNNLSVGTDTITIPAGCHVTFENVKFYSSVKLIVEKGAKLTLSDSVAYGTIEVNGGIFTMKNSAALVDSLILNDGSKLISSNIISNGHFLTDGSDKEEAETVVIVNGIVIAEGENSITGDVGSGKTKGQTALKVNGDLVIPKNSVFKAVGGGDAKYLPGRFGGKAVILDNGRILGEGSFIAIGGVGTDGPGGDGIIGNGDVSVSKLESIGGDSIKFIEHLRKGGDAIGTNVAVMTKSPILKGGAGNPVGTAVVTKTTPTITRPNVTVPPSNNNSGSGGGYIDAISGATVNSSGGSINKNETQDEVKNETSKTSVDAVSGATQKSDKEKNKAKNEEKKQKKIEKAKSKKKEKNKAKQKNKKKKNKRAADTNKKDTNKKNKKGTNIIKIGKEYFGKVKEISFIQVLEALKIDTSFYSRKQIAQANGIKNYTGTEKQNKRLLKLAKQGKLKRPKKLIKLNKYNKNKMKQI